MALLMNEDLATCALVPLSTQAPDSIPAEDACGFLIWWWVMMMMMREGNMVLIVLDVMMMLLLLFG